MSLQQTAKIIFSGEDDVSRVMVGIGGHLDNFEDQLGNFNSAIGDVTAPFASLAGGILKADAALAALAAGGLTYAYKKSMDFQSASIELQKVIGNEAELLEVAKLNARGLSLEYGESANDILASTANFKQAGFNIEEAMGLTKNALDLVIAGELDAAVSSELLIATLKGFRAPASEATRLIDILNEVSNNYATNVEELAIGMAELSPITQKMGFSMEETAGVLTPVIEIFRSGGEAAVALKTGLLKLVDDAAPVQEALDSIGVSQEDANGKLRSGKDILYDVAKAFQTLDEDQKLFVTQQLVGIQQSARMVEVFDNLSLSSEITATALKSTGSAALEVAARLASSEVAVRRFVSGFEGLAITVGDEFQQAATSAVNGGTEILNALDSVVSSGALDPLFDTLEEGLNELGEFLSTVAETLPEAFEHVDFGDLLESLRGLGVEIEGLFDGVDLTTPEGLAEAIQLVVDGVEGLANVTSGMVSGARPFLEMLLGMVNGFIAMDDETQRTIGSVTGFMGALNQMTGPIGAVISSIGGISKMLHVLAGVSVFRLVAGLVGSGGLTAAFGSVATAAGGLVSTLAGPIGVAIAAFAAGSYMVVDAYLEWQAAESELEGSLERGAGARQLLADKYAEISEQIGITITDTEHFHKLINEGTIALDNQTGKYENLATKTRDYAAELKAASDAGLDWSSSNRQIVDEFNNLYGTVDKATAAIDSNKKSVIAAAAAYYELSGNTPEVARQIAEMEYGVQKSTETMKEATEQTEAMKTKLLDLASDERIRSMELSVDIKIADIEAETKKFEKVFDSVDNMISTTSENITALFGLLGDTDDFGDKWAIEEQLEKENELRDKAAKQQERLVDAQTEQIELRNEQMRNGESMITVQADGLEPHLQMIFREILKVTQVSMLESEDDFLLV